MTNTWQSISHHLTKGVNSNQNTLPMRREIQTSLHKKNPNIPSQPFFSLKGGQLNSSRECSPLGDLGAARALVKNILRNGLPLFTLILFKGLSIFNPLVASNSIDRCDNIYIVEPNTTPEEDSLELVRFYNATNGPNWLTTWDLNQPMSTWVGVTLNNQDMVLTLILGNNSITGPLLDLNLPSLTTLILDNNNLSGSIPDFSNLPNLIDLSLQNNNLTGSIPDFSNLPNLIDLSLQNNSLTGNIPDFSNLAALLELRAENNNLSGSLPDFSNIPNLQALNFFNNSLTGSVPDFSNIPLLYFLDLGMNQITGTVPDFSNLPNLMHIHLAANPMSGGVPDFSNLPKLQRLLLSGSRLTGSIPDFSNLPELTSLQLAGNDFSGPIPDFSNMPKLIEIFINGNELTGSIPDFSNLPVLSHLWIRENNLSGSIPDFSNLPELTIFDANNNELTGPIPDFSNLPKLRTVFLELNQLTGPLPDFSNLPRLETLYLEFNNIGDTIPNFSNLPNLENLYLRNNAFTYANKITNLPFLEIFDIRGNQLTFDDILRNIGITNFFGDLIDYRYGEQAPIPAVCDTIWAATGSNLAIRLYFDEALTDNVYQWFRFGQPYLTTQGQNRLNIYDLQPEDAGQYSWLVTNPNVPDLTLTVDPIYLQVDNINQDSLNHLQLFMSDVFGRLGDTICFDVQAEPFDSLSSLDLSMKWDTTIMQFVRVDNFNLPDLEITNFDLSSNLTNNGRLTLSWESLTNLANGGESTQEVTSLYNVCLQVQTDTCRNGLLEFTNDPLPLQVSNALDSCVFFDGRPGIFISSCNEEFRIPDESMYLAQTEYTDTLGFTNYIKKSADNSIVDTLLLSIKKNNREIGNVNDGRFEIAVQKTANTIDVTSQIQNLPGFEQIDQAIALDYWWFVQPNYTFVEADTTFGLNFYFEQEDLDRLSAAIGSEVRTEDILFYKISDPGGENPCQNLAIAFDPTQTQVYTNSTMPSTSTWRIDNFGETSFIGMMDIDGFSCGGMVVILQSVAAKEITGLEKIILSPNPSIGQLNLDIHTQKQTNLQLKILNNLGHNVYHKGLNLFAGSNRKELSLQHLPSGIYFLQLQNEQGKLVSRKFVIMK